MSEPIDTTTLRVYGILRDGARDAYLPGPPDRCLECGLPLRPDDGYSAAVNGVPGRVCPTCNLKEEPPDA